MGFVFDHEHHIGGNVGGRFVALLGKSDLGALLPAALYIHRQDLVFFVDGAAVGIQPLAGNLHLLGAAGENLLQAHVQLVHHGGVLPLLVRPVRTTGVGFESSGKPAHAAHAECTEGIAGIEVIPSRWEEVIEGATASEELCENGVRVSAEGVVKSGPTRVHSALSRTL